MLSCYRHRDPTVRERKLWPGEGDKTQIYFAIAELDERELPNFLDA